MKQPCHRLALLIAIILAACTERDPAGPVTEPVAPPVAAVRCDVDAAAGTMTCAAPSARSPRGVSADIILGGQNVYVELISGNITVVGDVFSVDVNVRNLIAQALGTTDGTTPEETGVRVFFAEGPSNGVEVANETGTGTFMASGQPYFEYSGTDLGADGVLASQELSAAKQWQFTLNGAMTFQFGVYVNAAVPNEQGVLRWQTMFESPTWAHMEDVWGSAPDNVYAVSQNGDIVHYDGTNVVAEQVTSEQLHSVYGSAADNIYAVGTGGSIWHYDGASWTDQSYATTQAFYGVWTGATGAVAVGTQGTAVHFDGTDWSAVPTGITTVLYGVWGSAPTDVFAVGTGGTILHYDGTSWSSMTSGTTDLLIDVWGTASNNVYAVTTTGAILHYDGSSWTAEEPFPDAALLDISGTSANDIFISGYNGDLLHFDGSSWTNLAPGLLELRGVWASGGGDAVLVGHYGKFYSSSAGVWSTHSSSSTLLGLTAFDNGDMVATGEYGTALRYDGSSWSFLEPAPLHMREVWGTSSSDFFATAGKKVLRYVDGTWTVLDPGALTNSWYSIWGSSSTDVFVVGQDVTAAIRHYDGSSWTSMTIPAASTLFGVWGTGPTDVFAVGTSGAIFHFDGSAWTAMSSGTTHTLWDVWGTSSSDVYAVGASGTILHYDGATWTPMASGTTQFLRSIHGASSTDLYVAGNSGTVRHYNGSSWSTIRTGEFVTYEEIVVRNDRVYAVAQGATVAVGRR